jgi:hypothetical protein
MWVFIKGISSDCSARELARMVNRLINPGWAFFFNRVNSSGIVRSKVLKTMYNLTSKWEYHGLLYITPSESAHEIIGRLNAAHRKGKTLHAHPYIHRQSSRDRRRLILDYATPFPGERRKRERRRVNLVSQVVDSMS